MADGTRILSHLPLTLLEGVAKRHPGVEIVVVPQSGAVPADARGEILLTFAWGSENLAELVERAGVRWVHTIGTGVDGFPLHAVGDRVLTCSRGASAIPIAEWVLAVMLAHEKDLPGSWASEPPERWNMAELGGLHGIGLAVATRALAFGMRVRAFRRSDAPSPLPEVELAPSLADLLASADHVVLAAPATPETRGLLDRDAFAAIRRGAHLVNVARGSLVDQDALRAALDEGRVARASLDVCDPEPLPAGHWLYAHPRVRLSPHISWCMPGALERLFDTFDQNLGRWLDGKPLEGVVDVERGY